MLISFNWLKDFTEVKDTPEKLAQKLTMAGIEINSIDKVKNDFIYDAEITPNRPDLLSIIGIAREASCLSGSKFKPPREKDFHLKHKDSNITVDIKASGACLRYNATLIKGVKIKVSKKIIAHRLLALGLRPVNNIVDITNYCLFESGQPLHAFDYDKIKGKKIIVRWANKNETMKAIDGKEYKLDNDILVIADEEKPIAIAGIMGGLETEIGLETKNILLECAHFDPVVTRRAARKLGLSSDSSYRFERGICLYEIPQAAKRAAHLIKDDTLGVITDNLDILKTKIDESYTRLRIKEVERILGFSLSLSEIKRILTGLGFEVGSLKSDELRIKIPPFREDVAREIDLIEEIIRIYGYDNIPIVPAKISPKRIERYKSSCDVTESFKYKTKQFIKDILISFGLNEVITYSLLSKKRLERSGYKDEEIVILKNPLSVEQEVLRPTVINGLLEVIGWNLRRQIENAMVFELGKVFLKKNSKLSEKERLGIALCGSKSSGDWQIKEKAVNFFDLKGIIESFLIKLGISNYNFIEVDNDIFTKGHSAKVTIGKETIAVLGKVKEDILSALDITKNVFAAEVYFEKILPNIKLEKKVKPLTKFPAVLRDLAVIIRNDLPSNLIIEQIKKTGKALIKEVTLFDLYTGKQVPSGYKSLAYSIKYQSKNRTLTDEEVDKVHTEIQRTLVENLKAQIR